MNLITKITQMIKQAYISRVTNDSDTFPKTEVSYKSKKSKAIRLNPYGLCTNPPLNANVVLLSIHGQESLKYALTDDMQNRFKNLKEGEVVLFNYMSGSYIYLKKNGDIETACENNEIINIVGDAEILVGGNVDLDVYGDATIDVTGSLEATAGTTADITAPAINLNGSVTINGTLAVAGGNAATFSSTVAAVGEVSGNGKALSTHTHPYTWTDPPGSGDTGEPN